MKLKQKRVRLSGLFRPAFILSLVLLLQLVCAVLFLAGIIPSYTLKAHNLDVLGAGTYFLMMFSLVTVLVAMQPKGNTVDAGISLSEQIDVKKLEKLVIALTAAGFLMTIWVISSTIEGKSIIDYFQDCIRNSSRYAEEFDASPFRISIIVPMVNSALVPFLYKRRAFLGCLFGTLAVAALLSLVFGSRLVLLFVAFVLFASMTRLWFYDKEISLGTTLKIGIVLAVAALFFVYVQGNRDYELAGGAWHTDSVFIWGISRMIDYPLSTIIYISHFPDMISTGFPVNVEFFLPSLQRLGLASDSVNSLAEWLYSYRTSFGQGYYTNLGGFGDSVFNVGFAGILLIPIYLLIAATAYRSYSYGRIGGLIYYPIVYYTLFEFWRTFYLTYETLEIALLILFVIYLAVRKRKTRR